MKATSLRDRIRREERLDEEWFHLFSLDEMLKALRSEGEYEANGHTGLTLLKTPNLRVVLEAVRAGTRIGEHAVSGPTVLHVLQGTLEASSEGETRLAHAGEMMVIPHHRARHLRAQEGDVAFLWVLSMDGEAAQ